MNKKQISNKDMEVFVIKKRFHSLSVDKRLSILDLIIEWSTNQKLLINKEKINGEYKI